MLMRFNIRDAIILELEYCIFSGIHGCPQIVISNINIFAVFIKKQIAIRKESPNGVIFPLRSRITKSNTIVKGRLGNCNRSFPDASEDDNQTVKYAATCHEVSFLDKNGTASLYLIAARRTLHAVKGNPSAIFNPYRIGIR